MYSETPLNRTLPDPDKNIWSRGVYALQFFFGNGWKEIRNILCICTYDMF